MMCSSRTTCFVALFLVVIATTSYAFPQDRPHSEFNSLIDVLAKKSLEHAVVVAEYHHRSKRVTCDLLSAVGVHDSACAAKCLFKGKSGGYCDAEKKCICRS